MDVCCDYDNVF